MKWFTTPYGKRVSMVGTTYSPSNCFVDGYDAAAKERDQIIAKLVEALRVCEKDFWFMSNLLEHYSSNHQEAMSDCIKRMKFRKPIFDILRMPELKAWRDEIGVK